MKRKGQLFISDWVALVICIFVMILVLWGVSALISSFKDTQTKDMDISRGNNFNIQNLRTFLQSEAYYNGEMHPMSDLINIFIKAKQEYNSKQFYDLIEVFKEQQKVFFKDESYKFGFFLENNDGDKLPEYSYNYYEIIHSYSKSDFLLLPYRYSSEGEKIVVVLKND